LTSSADDCAHATIEDSPNDMNDVPLLHRRVLVFENNNAEIEFQYLRQNIARIRCLSVDAEPQEEMYDIRTVAPYRTIRCGNVGTLPESCVGLSVAPSHKTTAFVVESSRDEADFSSSVVLGGKKILRLFCYSAPSSELPPRYKIRRDNADHAYIYSTEECDLDVPNSVGSENVQQLVYQASLPEIADMPWKFCCSLLAVSQAKYDCLVAGGTTTVEHTTFRDQDVADIYAVLSEHQFISEHVSSCEKSRELRDWLEENLQGGALSDLSNYPRVLSETIGQLYEYQFKTTDVSTCERARELQEALEAVAEQLEASSESTFSRRT
jgi:hypothetical protein